MTNPQNIITQLLSFVELFSLLILIVFILQPENLLFIQFASSRGQMFSGKAAVQYMHRAQQQTNKGSS